MSWKKNMIQAAPASAIEKVESLTMKYLDPDSAYDSLKKLDREDLETIQEKKFLKSFRRAYDEVDAYREACDEAGIKPTDVRRLDDIKVLPLLDKKYFTQNSLEDIRAVPEEKIASSFESSATMGEPKVVEYSKKDLERMYDHIRVSLGVHDFEVDSPLDKVKKKVNLSSHQGETGLITFVQGDWISGKIVDSAMDRESMNSIWTGMEDIEEQIKIIEEENPEIIFGLPAYLGKIAKSFNKYSRKYDKLEDTPIRTVVVGGEPSGERKKTIATEYGAEVVDSYGSTELGIGISTECEKNGHIHFIEDIYPELIDAKGKEGELVLSNLSREAVPILRYRTGDWSELERSNCPCGLSMASVDVKGRRDYVVHIGSANTSLESIDRSLEGKAELVGIEVDKSKIDRDEVKLKLYSDNGVTAEEANDLIVNHGMAPPGFYKMIENGTAEIKDVEVTENPPEKSKSGKTKYDVEVIR